MPKKIFFAFSGYGDIFEGQNSEVEVWDLARIGNYESFVTKIREKMEIHPNADFDKCVLTKAKISNLYEKCKWGILLTWDDQSYGEYAIQDLINLYSSDFLRPYFYVIDLGPIPSIYFSRERYRQQFIDQDQNQSQIFASTKFSEFFQKMQKALPLLQTDRSKTCNWEYDDCNLYLANGLYQDLEVYESKNPEKAGREYADITMILELLTTTKDEREKSSNKPPKTYWDHLKKLLQKYQDKRITTKIKKRAAIVLSLSSKKRDILWKCIDQRGNYLHGEFVQEVLDVLKDECAEISGTANFDSAPSLRLVDFDFAGKCTKYTRHMLVALLYIHTKYKEWCKSHGGFAKLADTSLSNHQLKALLQDRTQEIIRLLP